MHIGHRKVFLAPAEYRYTISYETHRQVGYFQTHDALYLRLINNGSWEFPIEQASALVKLPGSIPSMALKLEAFNEAPVSRAGQDQAYRTELKLEGAYFETTGRLNRHDEFAIRVSWPKGLIQSPSFFDKLRYVLEDNREWVVCVSGVLILLGYYLLVWFGWDALGLNRINGGGLNGDNKALNTLLTMVWRKGYSATFLRHIWRGGYDHRSFAAALLELESKGVITLHREGHSYAAEIRDSQEGLTLAEKTLVHGLFNSVKRRVSLTALEQERIRAVAAAHKSALDADYKKRYFKANAICLVVGMVLTAIIMAVSGSLLSGTDNLAAGLMGLWVVAWTTALFHLSKNTLAVWHDMPTNGNREQLLLSLAFMGIFSIGEGIGILALTDHTGWAGVILAVCCAVINFHFYDVVKSPVWLNRQFKGKFATFRSFLARLPDATSASPDSGPVETPDARYQDYLPYVVALDLDQSWQRYFSINANRYSKGSFPFSGCRETMTSIDHLTEFAEALHPYLKEMSTELDPSPASATGSDRIKLSGEHPS